VQTISRHDSLWAKDMGRKKSQCSMVNGLNISEPNGNEPGYGEPDANLPVFPNLLSRFGSN
jgi:hypothetical protein